MSNDDDDSLNSPSVSGINLSMTENDKNMPTKHSLNKTNEHYSNSLIKKRCDQQCFQKLLSVNNYLDRFQFLIGPNQLNLNGDLYNDISQKYNVDTDNINMDFDFCKIGPQREPIKTILTSSIHAKMFSDEPLKDINESMHLYKLQCNQYDQFHKSTDDVNSLRNFSTGIMLNNDTFDESTTSIKNMKVGKHANKKTSLLMAGENSSPNTSFNQITLSKEKKGDNEFVPEISRKRRKKHFIGVDGALLLQRDTDSVRFRFYCDFICKTLPKVQRFRNSVKTSSANMKRKLMNNFEKYVQRCSNVSEKNECDFNIRAKKVFKGVRKYGKRLAKSIHLNKKKREQLMADNQKQEQQYKDMKRQQRKLNYLITQTELFSHFMALQNSQDSSATMDVNNDELAKILSILDEEESTTEQKIPANTSIIATKGNNAATENDKYDIDEAKTAAMESIRKAVEKQNIRLNQYQNSNQPSNNINAISTDEYFQKKNIIFHGKLKGYQYKGVAWLGNLYDKGFNGILADEMGLGKTVQTMAFLAYLAETRNLWGPFLIISPSSTLHNWQQEFSKFVPEFNVLPYWGSANERKLLRSFWNSKKQFLQSREGAPFHVLVTSYQLVIRDVQFFTKLNWQYMVLDEAQAIKCSQSQRWNKLLGFKCRNRLLLTGTPMQNTMSELWSLLHFIMPILFDSHEEFNEWFSKDIEGRVENKAEVDQTHLARLHMILQPFMLRRTKKEVEKELADKVEILINCGLSLRQKFLYQIIKEKISNKDIIDAMSHKIGVTNKIEQMNSYKKLMNLVMQFRKVCNHPALFENRGLYAPLYVKPIEYSLPNLFMDRQPQNKLSASIRNLFNIYSPKNVVDSFFDNPFNSASTLGALYFTRISPDTLFKCFFSIFYRFQYHLYQLATYQTQLYHNIPHNIPHITSNPSLNTSSNAGSNSGDHLLNLTMWPKFKLACVQTMSNFSDILNKLVFIRNNTTVNTYGIVKINPVCTFSNINNDESIQVSPMETNEKIEILNDSFKTYPNLILTAFCKKVTTAPVEIKMISKRAAVNQINLTHVNKECEKFMFYGNCDNTRNLQIAHKNHWSYNNKVGFSAICSPQGWSNLIKSDPSELIVDSNKLLVLHSLLSRLKSEGHRVLIYSQMTKTIDILENYLMQVKYKYVRLDGSSKMSHRRETVSDFQTNTDIFVFLLSTRAGGVGINLTAADTVIFYDSDWNPTVDQQAMDRAHRLGQTRQVTVYRLVCMGTIEERILETANQKSLVQKMIISGKDKNKSLKPKEIVALLLDNNELQQRMKSRKETVVKEPRKTKAATTTTTNSSAPKKAPMIKTLMGSITKVKRKKTNMEQKSPKKKPKV